MIFDAQTLLKVSRTPYLNSVCGIHVLKYHSGHHKYIRITSIRKKIEKNSKIIYFYFGNFVFGSFLPSFCCLQLLMHPPHSMSNL